jgi:hypothetical protein
VYLKPNYGHQGQGIFKVSANADGSYALSTDSSDMAEQIALHCSPAGQPGLWGTVKAGWNAVKIAWIKEKTSWGYTYAAQFPNREAATHFMKNLRDYIAEEAVPVATIQGKLVEGRLLFKDKNGVYGLDAWYAKVSGKGRNVAANITIGGSGEDLPTMVGCIIAERMPSATTEELQQITFQSMEALTRKAQLFLDEFLPRIRCLADRNPNDNRNAWVDEMAIDVFPSWNDEQRCVEWYFNETTAERAINPYNRNIGKTGLRRAFPQLYDRNVGY